MRTLDELDVCEVVSTPYFPSSMERKQRQGKEECENEVLHSESYEVGFGIRRRHRCFVVTARARSFLYHQVINITNPKRLSFLVMEKRVLRD